MTIIKNGIETDEFPRGRTGNPARPFANRPTDGGLCDEDHPMVARYRYYGWWITCVICNPDEDEDLL